MPLKKFRNVCIAALTASTALVSVTCAQAMDFHRRGDMIIASGQFNVGDDARLRKFIDAARAANIPISTVVFRASPGGNALAGTSMGNLIRELGLDTVYHGGCFSACTAGFVGGVNRSRALEALPLFHPNYEKDIFGIHGTSSGNVVALDQSSIVAHYTNLLEGEIPPEALARIQYAITNMKDSQAFLRYYGGMAEPETTYCPTGDTSADDCIPYADVTIEGDGIVNAPIVSLADDYLWVRGEMSGNINSGYRPFSINDTLAPSLDEAYGIIRVVDSGVWHVTERTGADIITAEAGGRIIYEPGTNAPKLMFKDNAVLFSGIFPIDIPLWTSSAPTPHWTGALDGGRIELAGGSLSSQLLTVVRVGGSLSGHGTLASNTNIGTGGLFAPDGISVKPFELAYQFNSDAPSRVSRAEGDVVLTLGNGSNTLFNVSSGRTSPNLSLVEAEVLTPQLKAFILILEDVMVAERHRGRLAIGDNATMTLNVEPGYFPAGHLTTLVQATTLDGPAKTDENEFAGALLAFLGVPAHSTTPFISGQFASVKRDASDAGIEFESGAIFSPRENSLLTFTLNQDDTSISMVANPAFDDLSVFRGSRVGDSLGTALREASYEEGTPLASLLGPLQFANRDIARREAGALRGDGYATSQLASREYLEQFTSAVSRQLVSKHRAGFNQAASHGSPSAESALGASPYSDAKTVFWATGFGQSGSVEPHKEIDGISFESIGGMLGLSRQFGERANIGAAFGYGRLNADDDLADGVSGKADSYAGILYGDLNYGRGYISAQAGYHSIDYDMNRVVQGIEGLEGVNRGEFSANAITAALEHGIIFNPNAPTRWTAIIPTIEYVNQDGLDFTEASSNPTRLAIQGDDFRSVRLGAGVEVSRQFTTSGGRQFVPYARAMYKREVGDRHVVLANNFALDSDLKFASASRQLDRDIVEWNVGVDAPVSQDITFSLDYKGQASSSVEAHNLKVMLSLRF